MVDNVVYKVLSANTDVSALVSDRITPLRAGQIKGWPFITYSIINNQANETDSGGSAMDFVRVQVNCYAVNYAGIGDLSTKVRSALDNYSGTVDGTTVANIEYEDENDLYDEDFESAGRALDFKIVVSR